MNLEIVRHGYGPTETRGRMMVGETEIHTLERPWKPDQLHGSSPSVSCVPDGEYRLIPHSTDKYPDTWALVNEDLQVTHYQAGPGRFAILFHSANVVEEVEGCIAPGLKSGIVDLGYWRYAVLDSRKAMDHIRAHLGEGEHTLTIRPTEGADHGRSRPGC